LKYQDALVNRVCGVLLEDTIVSFNNKPIKKSYD
jgi:hypothetical protein